MKDLRLFALGLDGTIQKTQAIRSHISHNPVQKLIVGYEQIFVTARNLFPVNSGIKQPEIIWSTELNVIAATKKIVVFLKGAHLVRDISAFPEILAKARVVIDLVKEKQPPSPMLISHFLMINALTYLLYPSKRHELFVREGGIVRETQSKKSLIIPTPIVPSYRYHTR